MPWVHSYQQTSPGWDQAVSLTLLWVNEGWIWSHWSGSRYTLCHQDPAQHSWGHRWRTSWKGLVPGHPALSHWRSLKDQTDCCLRGIVLSCWHGNAWSGWTSVGSCIMPVQSRGHALIHACIYTYIYTYIHIHIHCCMSKYIHTYVFTWKYTCMHPCISVYIHTCTYTYIHIHACPYIQAFLYAYNIHVCVHSYIHGESCMANAYRHSSLPTSMHVCMFG